MKAPSTIPPRNSQSLRPRRSAWEGDLVDSRPTTLCPYTHEYLLRASPQVPSNPPTFLSSTVGGGRDKARKYHHSAEPRRHGSPALSLRPPPGEPPPRKQKSPPTYPYNISTVRDWPSRDPIGERGGVTLYGMVKNRPLNSVDTDGRAIFCIAAIAILAVGSVSCSGSNDPPPPPPPNPRPQHAYELSLSDTDVIRSTCGNFIRERTFSLNKNSTRGGWIIQKMKTSGSIKKNCGHTEIAVSLMGGSSNWDFWEAFRVQPGTSVSEIDSWALEPARFGFHLTCTRGDMNYDGEAYFVEGALPAGMRVGCGAISAGDAPCSLTRPNFTASSNKISGSMQATWTCYSLNPCTHVENQTTLTPRPKR
jgi:hypothetical protein